MCIRDRWGGALAPPARSSTSGHVRRASGSGALGSGAACVPGLRLAGVVGARSRCAATRLQAFARWCH
eukprot:15470779-Alexandrium_andersonii.AAC.1